MQNKYPLIILSLIVCNLSAWSQGNSEHVTNISGSYFYGKILPHTKKINHLIKNNIHAWDVNFSINKTNSGTWQEIYKYPEVGIGLSYIDLGNTDVLGNIKGVYSYLGIPVIRYQRLSSYAKIGGGFALFNKSFHVISNPENNAIGSALNCYLNLKLELQYRLFHNIHLGVGAGINHFSNGNIKKPNLGINLLFYKASLSYQLGEYPKAGKVLEKEARKHHKLWAYIAPGTKQAFSEVDKQYFASTLSLNYAWQFTPKSSLGAGYDFFYDSSLSSRLKDEVMEDGNEAKYNYRNGVNLGYELALNRMSLITHFGIYLGKRDVYDEYLYYRIGLKYHIFEKVFVGCNLKTHLIARADYIEWMLGVLI